MAKALEVCNLHASTTGEDIVKYRCVTSDKVDVAPATLALLHSSPMTDSHLASSHIGSGPASRLVTGARVAAAVTDSAPAWLS